MVRSFAEITFTPAIKSANQVFERTQDRRDCLGRHEAEFVSSLNGFVKRPWGERLALIFMDYQNRRRIKIWGTARIVELGDDPALIASLTVADYKATVDRGVIITVEASE